MMIGDVSCIVYEQKHAECLLVQVADTSDLETLDHEVELIRDTAARPFVLAAYPVRNWNHDLSPLQAPPVYGQQGFGDGAQQTLKTLEEAVIPQTCAALEIAGTVPVVLGGCSLAGFFALWAAYHSIRFEAIAAVSPSMWFPGWIPFTKDHAPHACHIYLSLGDKEEKTKNKTMATVGNGRRLYADPV